VTCYGGIAALKGVSLEVADGELVALIGANGAGKTTMLRTISGLLRSTSGRIQFLGQRIDDRPPEAIVHLGIGHCPEERKIWPYLTVLEHLEMGAYTRCDRRAVARDIEDVFVRLPVLAERRRQLAGTLSGGEQQMLAIGRALMARTRLLMFDEPSLGLAPKLVEETAAIIRAIHARGTTILLVEQNAYLALTMAHRDYVMETGKIVMAGKAEMLLESPFIKRAYLGG
jgi:branched-chain amino acid transport system ATP-binding protein